MNFVLPTPVREVFCVDSQSGSAAAKTPTAQQATWGSKCFRSKTWGVAPGGNLFNHIADPRDGDTMWSPVSESKRKSRRPGCWPGNGLVGVQLLAATGKIKQSRNTLSGRID
jgi:hypothetical protein